MKPLKTAEQRNFPVNRDFYTVTELNEMLADDNAFYLTEGSYENWFCSDRLRSYDSETIVRIPAEEISDLKIEYSKEYTRYLNIAVLRSGKKIIIEL